jgi:Lon protease-like protein
MTERLALFPLDTVLVPGMALPLHIFERRYQIMMRLVLAGDRRFGVLLVRRGNELDPDPDPYDVGTIAEVTDVVPLEGGRMNISTTGRQRFRVAAFHHDQPYLSADIEVLADGYQSTEQLLELQEEVERLGLRYVTMMLTLTHEQITHVQLPRDPLTLSYKVAALFVGSVHIEEAQQLLASPTVEHRLYAEILLLRREVAIMQRMSEMRDPGEQLSPN